jgi:regulator of protease activity HflC (stomatin/prohibitin superfamily)
MAVILLIVGVVLALLIVAAAWKVPSAGARGGAAVLGLIVILLFAALASVRFVGAGEVGIVVKNALGPRLEGGKIIATEGQMGVQADVLSPGWHFWIWPVIYDVKSVPLTEVASDEVGLVEAADGMPLPEGQLFGSDVSREQIQPMLEARHFLTDGKGTRGKQSWVLTPGKYRLNTELFRVKTVKQIEVLAGEVAVIKSNTGTPPSQRVQGIPAVGGAVVPEKDDDVLRLAKTGEMGIRAEVLPPGKYPLNTDAFTVTEIWTTQMIAQFTRASAMSNVSNSMLQQQNVHGGGGGRPHDASMEEREITVRTSDGLTFPVDVRIEYVIEPRNAPIVVARLGDDEGERFRNALNSAVRAIFRNNAENVRALDYVKQRSHQESQSLKMLTDQMARFGVTVTAVRIGNVGDEQTLGPLLKTLTDREIAEQERLTFVEQEKAAEKKRELTRAVQEAEEAKKLATAEYAVKIAEQDKQKVIIAANAEAESIRIRAEAQAKAYSEIAAQIGAGNAALIELLKIVGERNIQITPRVMVNGGTGGPGPVSGAGGHGETTALIGTMLDSMLSRDDQPTPPRSGAGSTPSTPESPR